MKAFGTYISKYLASFAALLLALLAVNAALFAGTFLRLMTAYQGPASPRAMLEATAAGATPRGLTEEAAEALRREDIWAMYLSPEGECYWTLDLPEEAPRRYTIQDIALFSRGYLADYPVFVWSMEDGLLVLGYPKDSYMKLTSNYWSIDSIRRLPLFAVGMLGADLLCLFLAYCLSKRGILRSAGPIVAAVETLAEGRPASLPVEGELGDIADSVNRASQVLRRQNEARANWVRGVSHDIRTPLSMILGYAERIGGDETAGDTVREQAEIVRRQSLKIRELVRDLNLVSQLEYDMQPLHREPTRLAKLLRAQAAELLNAGLPDIYPLEVDISPESETAALYGDARLLSRAVGNLAQNSVQHNPQGCAIRFSLRRGEGRLILTVADDGVGMTPEQLRALAETPRYLEGGGEGPESRHGLGLHLARRITEVHGGTFRVDSAPGRGCAVELSFPLPAP